MPCWWYNDNSHLFSKSKNTLWLVENYFGLCGNFLSLFSFFRELTKPSSKSLIHGIRYGRDSAICLLYIYICMDRQMDFTYDKYSNENSRYAIFTFMKHIIMFVKINHFYISKWVHQPVLDVFKDFGQFSQCSQNLSIFKIQNEIS